MLDMARKGCADVASLRRVLARIRDVDAGPIEHRAGPDAVRLLGAPAADTVGNIDVVGW